MSDFNEKLKNAWFLSDIRTRILRVAFELADDPHYTKQDAINDLVQIIEPIDVEAQFYHEKDLSN